jgi:hypothetical protein
MNDLIHEVIDIKKDLANLAEQIEGASHMLNPRSPHYSFLKYIQSVIDGFHDKLAFQLKVSKEKSPPLNCS